MHQFITDGVYRNDLLLGNTRKIVVERASVDNILRRLADVRRLIHERRRIACPCTDAPLAA